MIFKFFPEIDRDELQYFDSRFSIENLLIETIHTIFSRKFIDHVHHQSFFRRSSKIYRSSRLSLENFSITQDCFYKISRSRWYSSFSVEIDQSRRSFLIQENLLIETTLMIFSRKSIDRDDLQVFPGNKIFKIFFRKLQIYYNLTLCL